MEITKEQKIRGYEYALWSIQKNLDEYICRPLSMFLLKELFLDRFNDRVTLFFDELKPYENFDTVKWFKSKEERIDVLQSIILKLKQTL